MTNVPLLYSDRELPDEITIKGPNGRPIIFPDECPRAHFYNYEDGHYKDAVEQEISTIRLLLPQYNYHLSLPHLADIYGDPIDDEYEIYHMLCINEFLKTAIIETGADLFFFNVGLGNDYDCVDDVDIIKFDLNRNTDELKKAYIGLYREWNIVHFIVGEQSE